MNIKEHLLTLAALALLAGCATPAAGQTITGDFTNYERGKILQAWNEWKAAAGREPPCRVESSPAAANFQSRFLLALVRPSLDAEQRTVTVFVNRLGDRDLTALMRHEFGHCYGLPHAERGVMSPDYNLLEWGSIDAAATSLARMELR
jgi:hypothetical protein